MSEKRTRAPLIESAAVAAALAGSSMAHAQEMQGADLIKRLEDTRFIGEASGNLTAERLRVGGTLQLPIPGIPAQSVSEEASQGSGQLRLEGGVSYTDVDWDKKDLSQFRVLAGVSVSETGDTETWARACYSNIENDTWGFNGCIGRNFDSETTSGEVGLLRRLGNRTAIGPLVSKDNFEDGNTNTDLVLRHDTGFVWDTMLRAELAAGVTREGGLAYKQEGTENRGNTHVGVRLSVTPREMYAGPLLGGEPGIQGGWYAQLEAGYAKGNADAVIPVQIPGLGALLGDADLSTEGAYVRLGGGVRF